MEERFLESQPICYCISGENNSESIMFVHAAFADHTQFEAQTEYFSGKYKVITIDLIGHGKSQNIAKNCGMKDMAGFVFEIMQMESIKKLHLVGVSLGSVVIQDFANKYPDKVASLAAFGGYDINDFDPEAQKENGGKQGLMMMKAIFSMRWFAKANKKISAVTPEAQQKFYEMNMRFPKRSFMYLSGLNELVNKYPSHPTEYPLLIGCGEYDIPMELKICDEWHENQPVSKKVVIKGAGHLVNMDAPDDFNEVILKFITGDI